MRHFTIKIPLSLCLLLLTWWTDAKIGFKKSLKMDKPFPVQVRKDAGLPEGHLRPLGHHKPAEGPVQELPGFPDISVFYYGFSKQRTPVVFRKALNDSQVFKDWESDQYLKDNFGKLNVSVITQRPILYKDEVKRTTQVMKIKKFLHEYEYEDWYITSIIPPEMQEQLQLPTILNCGVVSRYLQRPELWMSSGGTASKLHSHYDHNLHCVLFGRRDYVIIENRYKNNFEFKETYPNSGDGYSNIDMESVNMYKHKHVKGTPWTWATLTQGDCILVPSGYLHYVQAYGRSISYNILFSPTSDIDDEVSEPSCTQFKKLKGDYIKMSEATFTWANDGGKARLADRKLNDRAMIHHIRSILGDDKELYFDRFEYFYNKSMSVYPEHPPAQEVFDIMKEKIPNIDKRENKNNKGTNYLTRVDIHNINVEQLTKMAKIFNDPIAAMNKKKPKQEL